MRNCICLLILFMTLPALGQLQSAEILTVKLDAIPPKAQQAYLALDSRTRVPLEKQSDGTWSGEFLLLPGIYNQIPEPDIVLRDSAGNPFTLSEGMGVHITSSTVDLTQMDDVLEKETVVVYSPDVRRVVLTNENGQTWRPELAEGMFLLPTIEWGTVTTVRAEKDSGTTKYAFGRGVDLAELDDKL